MKHPGSSLARDGTISVDEWDVTLPLEPGVAVPASATAPMAAALPGDPLFANEWWLRNTGQSGGTPGMDIDVAPAWTTATGAGVSVVVNDTGIDYGNPDIAPNYDAAT